MDLKKILEDVKNNNLDIDDALKKLKEFNNIDLRIFVTI